MHRRLLVRGRGRGTGLPTRGHGALHDKEAAADVRVARPAIAGAKLCRVVDAGANALQQPVEV